MKLLVSKDQYSILVRKASEEHVKFLDGIENRGSEEHVDHIFPIIRGFEYGFDPKVLGGRKNLQMLNGRENNIKRGSVNAVSNETYREILGDFYFELYAKGEKSVIVTEFGEKFTEIRIAPEKKEIKTEINNNIFYVLRKAYRLNFKDIEFLFGISAIRWSELEDGMAKGTTQEMVFAHNVLKYPERVMAMISPLFMKYDHARLEEIVNTLKKICDDIDYKVDSFKSDIRKQTMYKYANSTIEYEKNKLQHQKITEGVKNLISKDLI